MKKIVSFLLLGAALAFAQSAPNCNLTNQILSVSGTGSNYNATSIKCVAWTFSYFSEGFSAVSIQVESAPDNGGVPGAFAIIPAASIIGTNPLTSTSSGSFTINGYFPWLRVNLTTATGTGFVNYSLIGNSYVGPSSSVATSSTITGTVPVIGPDANATPSTTAPVQIAGNDGTNVRRVAVTTGGSVGIGNVVTGADGIPNTQISGTGTGAALDLLGGAPYLFNGAAWNRLRSATITNEAILTGPSGAALIEHSGRFSVLSSPAAGTLATATTAGVAGQKRIADCVGFAASSVVAPALTALKVNLIDGVSGGTAIATWTVAISAATGQNVAPQMYCGLNLQNTTGNGLTLEFSAALANLSESVTLIYYAVQ